MAAFGTAIGGGSLIQQAMARRGITGPTGTMQVSPTAPTFNPSTQPAVEPTASAIPASTTQPTAPQPTATGATAMGNVATSEAQLIVRALSARLAALTKLETGGIGGGAVSG